MLFLFLSCGPFAQAGVVELGTTFNYRTSKVDKENFQESTSITGSFSYYFWELSAIELSYTNGRSLLVSKPGPTESEIRIETTYEMIGLDLVIAFAGRKSAFQPYIKLGGAYIEKEIVRKVDLVTSLIGSPKGLVPSAGLGFKIRFTQAFSFKVGADTWSTPLDEDPVVWDWAGRAGVAWMF